MGEFHGDLTDLPQKDPFKRGIPQNGLNISEIWRLKKSIANWHRLVSLYHHVCIYNLSWYQCVWFQRWLLWVHRLYNDSRLKTKRTMSKLKPQLICGYLGLVSRMIFANPNSQEDRNLAGFLFFAQVTFNLCLFFFEGVVRYHIQPQQNPPIPSLFFSWSWNSETFGRLVSGLLLAPTNSGHLTGKIQISYHFWRDLFELCDPWDLNKNHLKEHNIYHGNLRGPPQGHPPKEIRP